MRNFTMKKLALLGGVLFSATMSMQAIEPPTPSYEMTAGEKYVLFNLARLNAGDMVRTSWDGAIFYGTNANYADHALEPIKNEDGTWSFINTTPATEEGAEPIVTYLALPEGAGNANLVDGAALWNVEEGDVKGFYKLKAGEGNNTATLGMLLHLNKGLEYWVISYNGGNQWYPDYVTKNDEEGNPIIDEVTGNAHMADSASVNWSFVKVEDAPVYKLRCSAYVSISDYENAWLTTAGYEEGFKNGADAMAAIYTNEAFDDTYPDSIQAIINAKVALYNKIEGAIATNTDNNATLAAAIETAKKTFTEIAIAKTLNEAVETLATAEEAYLRGQSTGDYTNLGKNMSFEDLSAQGGNTTTGVGNAPTGWNLYLNGVLCQTAEEIRSAGIVNWCGVNADCGGEAKDGEMGFGIWTQGFPTVEISQTIDNIENGTYEISAALMVGANTAGSRRTTQRIFGNLNSTYFASMNEYNLELLDKSEVYDFANLVEPVSDTEMQPITVRAYVYDGKLTFGFRTDNNINAALRETSNAQGGDGWFKIDNFRITKTGYQASDALNVLNHFRTILDNYYYDAPAIYTETYNMLEGKIEELEGFDENSSQEDINNAIIKAKETLAIVEPVINAYEELADAIDAAYDNANTYGHMPGANAYVDFIMNIEENYSDGIYAPEEIPAVIESLEAALEDCKKSEISVGKDITYLIANPSFENQKATQPNGDTGGIADAPKGWTLTLNGVVCNTAAEISAQGIANWCAINSGDPINVETEEGVITQQPTEGSKLWGIWTSNVPEVELSQTITGLPKGTYIMTADVMVENNWAGDNLTTQRIFANNFVQMFSYNGLYEINMPSDALTAKEFDLMFPDENYPYLSYAGWTCNDGDPTTKLLHTMSVKFFVDETGIAKIGFRTNGVNPNGFTFIKEEVGVDGQGWFKLDNFTLFYESEEMPTGIKATELNDAAATVVSSKYYTIDGREISAPQQGITIVKSILNNGTVKVNKLLVK